MSPKEQYDARKAERDKLAKMDAQIAERVTAIMALDIADRLVTALELIATALAIRATSGPSTSPAAPSPPPAA